MSIIISEKGINARKLEPTSIAQEDYLQAYIKNNPHTIPIDEIREDLRLLVLAREFPTGSGPIDALGIDQEGNIYIIETKLAKNPDKRYVLAQVLDYGAALWRTYENSDVFVERLERSVAEAFGSTLGDKIRDFIGGESEEAAGLLQTVRQNLGAGDFRFVVLMDRLNDRLKDLITFVNRNSQFTIYGVEMEFYKFDKFEILIPKLFGAEVTKEVSTPKPAGAKQKWDEVTFFAKVEEQLSPPAVEGMRKLYEFSVSHGQVKWNTNQTGTYSVKFSNVDPKRAYYTVYSTGGLELNLSWHEDEKAIAVADALRGRLRQVAKLDNGKNFQLQHVGIRAEEWTPHVSEIVEVIRRTIRPETEATSGHE
jgi:hypothetical protein